MRKTFFAITSVLLFGLTFYFLKNLFLKKTDTPNQFLNKTVTEKESYSKDSLTIVTKLKDTLLKHKNDDFFYSKEYFEGTEIIIDTIVYSPDLNKLGILIITKNPTSRQLLPTKDKDYYYNATVYLSVRLRDTLDLSWHGPSFTNSTDKSELSKHIRDACFRILVSKDTTEINAIKYNLNDSRFWTSSIWQKIEKDKLKRKQFEEEKVKHPENVYEPSKK